MDASQPQVREDTPVAVRGGREDGSAQPGDVGETLTRHDSGQPLYLPLIDGHIIRLMELQPGAYDDQVKVNLILAELDFAPAYEALSYVWGDTSITTEILCNGREFDIATNLHSALVRLRYRDKIRILWADAICINQGHLRERSHHVAFMNLIYKRATKVMVCFGKDVDEGAKDVLALIDEHNIRRTQYKSAEEMPVLKPDDPTYDDPRWKALAVLMKCPWFTRAWVLQEAGVAKDPRAVYGDVEFKYRDLIQLARWVVKCAPSMSARVGFFYLTIHLDWEDWSPEWQLQFGDPNYTLLDFLSHARGLYCKDPKDHVYAFLGHPLAQAEDGGGPFLQPDYSKDSAEVFLELTAFLIKKFGFRTLSIAEHNEHTITQDFASWLFRWDIEMVQNSYGVYPGFYYNACSGIHDGSLEVHGKELKLEGIVIDEVIKSFHLAESSEALESPRQLRALKPGEHKPTFLDDVWKEVIAQHTSSVYSDNEWLDAFSLTLCGGLIDFECAEDDIQRHRANFAAYWKLRLLSTSTNDVPPELDKIHEGGDEERFWIDMDLCSLSRSFLMTQNGYWCLGPWIAQPGDKCFIFAGCRVPFILRKTEKTSHYRLVGEVYIHGAMRGELFGPQRNHDTNTETIIIC